MDKLVSNFMPDPLHRKRCKRFNTPGHAHYLTFSCFHRRPFLSRDRSRQWLVDAIQLARTKHPFDLWAYVIMPEHAHLIVFPTRDDYDISPFLTTVKTSVTRTAVAFVQDNAPDFLDQMKDEHPTGDTAHRFWQRGGGYDRNLQLPRDVHQKIQYLHNNPVKRDLCTRPEDWPWSSARDHMGIARGPLTLDLDSLPRDV